MVFGRKNNVTFCVMECRPIPSRQYRQELLLTSLGEGSHQSSRHQRLINLIHYRLVLRAKLLVEAAQAAMAVKGREV